MISNVLHSVLAVGIPQSGSTWFWVGFGLLIGAGVVLCIVGWIRTHKGGIGGWGRHWCGVLHGLFRKKKVEEPPVTEPTHYGY